MNKNLRNNKNVRIVKRKIKKKRISRKRKIFFKRITIVLSCLLALVATVWGLVWLVSCVFKITDIYVEGNTKYDDNEIIRLSGIKTGDNLFFARKSPAQAEIYKSLPYIDSVEITKKIPKTLKINIEMAEPMVALPAENDEYIIVSKKDKIIQKGNEIPPDVVKLIGAKFSFFEDVRVIYENLEDKKTFNSIVDGFKNEGICSIKEIDISNPQNVTVNYDDRIKIDMGCTEDLEYKIITAKEIIFTRIGFSEKGTLNLKNLESENRSYFIPE